MSRTVLRRLQKIDAPQGSVMGPFLFNVFINDMLYLVGEADICNYADDTTIYACDVTVDLVIDKLENTALRWLAGFPKIL